MKSIFCRLCCLEAIASPEKGAEPTVDSFWRQMEPKSRKKRLRTSSRDSSESLETKRWTRISKSKARVLIFSLAICCFLPSLDGDFVFDDGEAIVHNRDVRWSGGSNLVDLFRNDFWGSAIRSNTSHKSYRPLTILSFR